MIRNKTPGPTVRERERERETRHLIPMKITRPNHSVIARTIIHETHREVDMRKITIVTHGIPSHAEIRICHRIDTVVLGNTNHIATRQNQADLVRYNTPTTAPNIKYDNSYTAQNSRTITTEKTRKCMSILQKSQSYYRRM